MSFTYNRLLIGDPELPIWRRVLMITLIVFAVGAALPFYCVLPFYPFMNMEAPLGVDVVNWLIDSEICLMTLYQVRRGGLMDFLTTVPGSKSY